MTEIEETSKAIAETAIFGTKALDTGDKLGGFLSNVFGVSIENAVGIMGDKLQYLRWERQTRMIDKVNEYQKENDITTVRPIPPKFAIPMIENASLEEDNDLQDIWCKLIINSLDPNFDSEIRYAFIEIIKNLTSTDAKILKFTYDSALKYYSPQISLSDRDRMIRRITNCGISIREIKIEFDFTHEEIGISIDNLLRVRCLTDNSLEESFSAFAEALDKLEVLKMSSFPTPTFSMTKLGINFVEACLEL
ncbi:Abi-alpha family protein [Methanococcoides alaskense]|uniref:DUF4393 domain-containing protein n=1 Tax=Methanococcoides alaskense TaxID=325778 RepID=A0AA90TYZ6_9EURY|nr:Abi-alpha family protein [Methanococcoides alaskense]MDA0524104.1 Abi-alpha family protein [Methanococcoides alaskense]MDR6222554.1 hypothetical protein [Methanococcoides alaskense]